MPMPSRMRAFFILVADVHRRVAPVETSLEWLLLFASRQNVIKFEKDARPRLASKPSDQHSNNPCGHCGNRCPKCAADVEANLLFLASPLNFFHGANAGRTTALGQDRCPGHDRSCRAQHAPRRPQKCATRPLAPSLSWCLAEGFNGTPARRRHPTTAMALEPQCLQPISLTAATGAFSPLTLQASRPAKGRLPLRDAIVE